MTADTTRDGGAVPERTTVYLLELIDEAGSASQQTAFASLDGAKGSLDPDVKWRHYPEGDLWSGNLPDDYDNIWWITPLELKP